MAAIDLARVREAFVSTCTAVLPKAERDITHRSLHNQRVRTLTEPALNVSHGDTAGRYAQMRDTTRVHERALLVVPRIPSEL